MALLHLLHMTHDLCQPRRMAEETLKKVEDQLKCSICLDTYTNPRLLHCQHVYCHNCLTKLDRHASITCPNCRQVTPLRTRSVAGLQPALQTNCLLDIMEEHKRDTLLTSLSTTQFCPEHAGKEFELYCETCLELICLKCAVKGGRHHSHDYNDLENACDKCKRDITSSKESIEKELTTVGEVLASLDTCSKDISNQEGAVEVDINSTARQLHELIDARKAELINQLHQLAQNKKDQITAQRCQVEAMQTDLCNYLDFMTETLSTKNDMDILTMKMAIIMQVKEIPKPDQGVLKVELRFSPSSDATLACENYGQILESESITESIPRKRAAFPSAQRKLAARDREWIEKPLNEYAKSPVESIPLEIDEPHEELGSEIAGLRMKSSQEMWQEDDTPVATSRLSHSPLCVSNELLTGDAIEDEIVGCID